MPKRRSLSPEQQAEEELARLVAENDRLRKVHAALLRQKRDLATKEVALRVAAQYGAPGASIRPKSH
jgi:hypothetical protein